MAYHASRIKWFFVLPAVIWTLIFTLYPLLSALRLSFMSFNTTTGVNPRFVGLRNYTRMLTDDRFWDVVQTTLLFVAVSVTCTVVLGLLIALLFDRKIRGLRWFRGLAVMPMFASPIALGYLGITIFFEPSGPLNNGLQALGLPGAPWLSDSTWARASVLLVDIWQWTPFCFLVLLAGLQAIPEEMKEAAHLDTSSGWQIFRFITLPMLLPVLATVVLLRVIETFKMLDVPFALTNGGPGSATLTYSMSIYRFGLQRSDGGYAAAMSFGLLILLFVVSSVFLLWVRRTRRVA